MLLSLISKYLVLVIVVLAVVSVVEAKSVCDLHLSRIKNIPFTGEPSRDTHFDALMNAGKSAVPCLIANITNTRYAPDPRPIPGWGTMRTTVGHRAVYMLWRMTNVDPIKMLPPPYQLLHKQIGVYALDQYLLDRRANRRALQRKLWRWYSRSQDASMRPQLVSFPTEDGGLTYANLYGKGDRGVVLAHGGRFNKESWEKQARILVEKRFRVLAIDFRGRGQSRGGAQTQQPEDGAHFDVLAAVRYLRQTGVKTVSVIGASFGGGAAAEASIEAERGEIDRLILLAHSPIDKPEQMKGRKLFILSRDDFSGENKIPRLPKLHDQYERAPEPKKLVILEGSAHAQFIFETEHGDRLMREILRFLSD